MIFKRTKYRFDPETLTFVREKNKRSISLIRLGVLFLIVNATAFSLLFFLNSLVGSPSAHHQKKTNDKYAAEYRWLLSKVDSLTRQLHHNNFANDEIYRCILELDSLTNQLRTAGAGGWDPNNISFLSEPEELLDVRARIEKLKREVLIQLESYEIIYASARKRNAELKHLPGISPMKMTQYIWISSYFGARTDPFTHHVKYHTGLDLVGPTGTGIYATADGIVTLAKHSRKGYGNEIVIDHQFGYETRYAHLMDILVMEGEKVERGQLIGHMGSTGRSTGTHLHYEVRHFGKPVDPMLYFSDDLTPEEYEQLAKKTD